MSGLKTQALHNSMKEIVGLATNSSSNGSRRGSAAATITGNADGNEKQKKADAVNARI